MPCPECKTHSADCELSSFFVWEVVEDRVPSFASLGHIPFLRAKNRMTSDWSKLICALTSTVLLDHSGVPGDGRQPSLLICEEFADDCTCILTRDNTIFMLFSPVANIKR